MMKNNKGVDILNDQLVGILNRKRNGLTQEQLAEMLDISTRHLQRIEADFQNTTIEMLIKIINVLNIEDKDIICMLKGK